MGWSWPCNLPAAAPSSSSTPIADACAGFTLAMPMHSPSRMRARRRERFGCRSIVALMCKATRSRNARWERSRNCTIGKLDAPTIKRADIEGVIAAIDKPILANAVLSSLSAVFSWAQRKQIGGIAIHPCKGMERNETSSRERVLSDAELPLFWAAFERAGLEGRALQLGLLLGQRPGEIVHMRREHIVDGVWWEMPGTPVPALGWNGTKNGQAHRVWIPKAARAIIDGLPGRGFVLERTPGRALNPNRVSNVMRNVCTQLGIADKVTPHDMRRTHGTWITRLGFGRDSMNRIQNHREGGIASVYDRHQYADENKRIMETVAQRILDLTARTSAKVVALR